MTRAGLAVPAAFAVMAALAGPIHAQPAQPPDWPCIQRKVSEVSAAQVWTGPEIAGEALRWRDDRAIRALVETIAPRRTPMEEAERAIDAFAAEAGEEKADALTALMAGVLDTLNAERSQVIAGIERYGRRQKQFAEKIRAEASEIDAMHGSEPADEAGRAALDERLARLEEQLLWDTRIFEDRRKALASVCEVPVLIEQRMFALGRLIQARLE